MLIVFCIGFILAIVIIAVTNWLADWSVHISMNKYEGCPVIWGTYKKFLKEFNNFDKWKTKRIWRNSFFGTTGIYNGYIGYDYKIHANIFKFNHVCMNLYPLSYLRAKLFLRKKWKADINKIKK